MKLKGLFNFFKPYSVNVEFWNDSVISHRATNFTDALEWASCYPNECVVNIRNWRGKVVAMIGQR